MTLPQRHSNAVLQQVAVSAVTSRLGKKRRLRGPPQTGWLTSEGNFDHERDSLFLGGKTMEGPPTVQLPDSEECATGPDRKTPMWPGQQCGGNLRERRLAGEQSVKCASKRNKRDMHTDSSRKAAARASPSLTSIKDINVHEFIPVDGVQLTASSRDNETAEMGSAEMPHSRLMGKNEIKHFGCHNNRLAGPTCLEEKPYSGTEGQRTLLSSEVLDRRTFWRP
ncbi:hypothetical protein SKAU_G00203170 [Synaphobranchus kaupii]|uniref:Uncharacterized protein n=1 Tax=Synaphobranchus kaupii TaxID=118154 RepID=A0A9Q1FGD8_SYNKA|nr:hypothetical protein SKAU_G00203170 [Synaphobranchus kaupii]